MRGRGRSSNEGREDNKCQVDNWEEEDKLNMDFSCFKAFRPGRLLLLNEPLCSISHHGHGGPAITLAIEGSH
jgi:hypothetical protein